MVKNTENKSTRVIYLTDNIWDKQTTNTCIYKQGDIGYSSQHNNKYNYKNNNKTNIIDSIISYDTDGVMLWHGKRCESTPCTLEEQKEMEDLLAEFKGDADK